MPDVVFKNVWRQDNEHEKAQAIAFWQRIKQMPPEFAEQRSNELGVIAYSGDRIIATTTAELVVLPGLRARFGVGQIVVDPEFRGMSFGLQTTAQGVAAVEAWSIANPEEKVMGIAAVIQPNEWGDKKREPVWTDWDLNFYLVGYTPRGEQIRVSWFKHARL